MKLSIRWLAIVGIFLQSNGWADCLNGETKTTTTGAVFTCDTSHPLLGEAWRDPNGLIWGDAPAPVSNIPLDQINATCQSAGGHLPTALEYGSLQQFFGAKSAEDSTGYVPQVLAHIGTECAENFVLITSTLAYPQYTQHKWLLFDDCDGSFPETGDPTTAWDYYRCVAP